MEAVRVVRERAGMLESEHRVRVALWRHEHLVTAGGEDDTPVFLRSAAKPVQALACVVTGAADRFGMTPRELALACASHNGEPMHVEAARGMLARIGLSEADLLCGSHPPIHKESAETLIRDGRDPTPLHNNCSGKHAAMLAACVASGWTTADYIAPEHPLQRLNRRHIALYTGVAEEEIGIGIDGCSVPVFAVPLIGAARLVATVAAPDRAELPDDVRDAALRLRESIRSAPEMIGGTARSDTDVIRATEGRIVCKVGAEGVWCLGVAATGTGLTVKCLDGSSDAARLTGLAILREAGVLDDRAWEQLFPHHDVVRRNHRRLDVGRTRVIVPPALAEACR
jgi:L-asparaginase II